ncbi:diguanylate cyclase [Vibrio genomosp. F10 str. ZF-129]|nr:diguanylate cyclase [Vibrio genomosp. F10]OEE36544.1 diguanylate cyclase [Vibrio genomosp. F10 str. ZF-129]
MKSNRHFSLKFAILMPLVVSVVLMSLVVKSHYDFVDNNISAEYERLKRAMLRSTKVLTALDYNFTNYFQTGGLILLEHNRQVVEDLCQIWPIESLLRAQGKSHMMSAVDITYMLVGDKSICNADSELYERISSQVSLAPALSFMHDLDEFILGIHYFDKEGYVFSSPDTMARNVTKEFLDTIQTRPYWLETAKNNDKITVLGPLNSVILNKHVMGLTVPVYSEEIFEGIISLDIDVDLLLETGDKLIGEIRIFNTDLNSVPNHAFRLRNIEYEGIVFNHVIFYDSNLIDEAKFFIVHEKFSLLGILLIHIFLVLTLLYVNINVERTHFKGLAERDPMTGLLNRRGFDVFLSRRRAERMFALAIFDIDDFKRVNDKYGHDVGDDVICYMANQLDKNIRSNDAAARFGGEEFVVYIEGNDEKQLRKALDRVTLAITQHSKQAVKTGFTVSGGVEIVTPSFNIDFPQLIKNADEKLYKAKTSGKNQLVY